MRPTFQYHFHSIAFPLLWAHTELYLRKFPFKGNSRDIFGAGLWQNNLMHGFWQQQQQYLHTGIGPSLLSEVTHSPWIMLPCSRVLWSWMLTVWPLLNVVFLLSSCSSHLHHHTFQPLNWSRKAKKIEQNRIEVVCNVSSQYWLAGPHFLIHILKRLEFNEHSLWMEEWLMDDKKTSERNKTLQTEAWWERQRAWKKSVFLFAACLFWQLRHGANLAVCLSGSSLVSSPYWWVTGVWITAPLTWTELHHCVFNLA